jgi:hypothetical protein
VLQIKCDAALVAVSYVKVVFVVIVSALEANDGSGLLSPIG